MCLSNELLKESRRCILGPCPVWLNWEKWSSECASCSIFETRKRKRICIVKISINNKEEESQVPNNLCSGCFYLFKNLIINYLRSFI